MRAAAHLIDGIVRCLAGLLSTQACSYSPRAAGGVCIMWCNVWETVRVPWYEWVYTMVGKETEKPLLALQLRGPRHTDPLLFEPPMLDRTRTNHLTNM